MNKPESSSKATHRSYLETRQEKDLERVIFFSDAVFAIAITLLALDIRLPSTTTDANLFDQLLGLGSKYYSYCISFLAIGLYWLEHHRMFQYIIRYDSLLLILNLLLLMVIAFIPFPSSVIGDYNDRTATVFYALTITTSGLISGGIWLYASFGGRLLTYELDQRSFRFSQVRSFLAPTLFLLSAAVALWNTDVARILWYLIALVALIIVLLTGRWTKKAV